MKTRVISGAVLAVLLLVVLLAGGPVLCLALLLCSLSGMHEMYRALGVIEDGEGIPLPAIGGFVGVVLYYVLLFFTRDAWYGALAALVILGVMACYVAGFPKATSQQALHSVFGFVYVGFLLSFIYLLRIEEKGRVLVWLVFISSWVADTCAYFVGMKLGSHKMTPVLSPKKTWEGAIGGVLGAGLVSLLFAGIFLGTAGLFPCFLICSVGAVISIFGDLAASGIKREMGIKDYGTLIPGHGGIMDRFDSVIFTAPAIYFLSQLLL